MNAEPSPGGLTLSHGLAAAIGAALVAIGRALWGALQKSRDGEILVLREQLAVERAERTRLSDELQSERAEHDLTKDRMLGLALRVRTDPAIPNEFENEFPTAVRNRAELVAPKSMRPDADPHPELAGWDPNVPTPPGGRASPPRPRVPSRPK